MQTLQIERITKQQQETVEKQAQIELIENAENEKRFSNTQAQTQHQHYHQLIDDSNIGQIDGEKIVKQNRTQTTTVQPTNHNHSTTTFQKDHQNHKLTREQCLESIRLSYMVLGTTAIEQRKSPLKHQHKIKKSFVVVQQQVLDNNNESPKQNKIITKQQLKQPLLINLKKIQSSSTNNNNNNSSKKIQTYYNELSQDLYHYSIANKRWQHCHIDIEKHKKQLIISNLHIPLLTIEKIKIFKPNPLQKMKQIKLNYQSGNQSNNLFLNVKQDKLLKKLPINYLIFQQIINQKLINQNTHKQTKWSKQPHICQQVIFQSYIFGQIYKKSQYWGKWEKRYIVLNSEGVFSYKSGLKKEDYSFFIDRRSIEYLWSRFDMIDNYLIVKIKHGMKQTEFGIPVTNYSHPHFKNWLYYFYKLME